VKLLRFLWLCLLPIVSNCENATDMKTIRDVKRAYEAKLLALPDVVSVGIGTDGEGSPVIVVGLTCDNMVTRNQVPKKLEGYPVVVRATGVPEAQ